MNHLYPRGYKVFNHDVKVVSHDRSKYCYPDIFVTKEPAAENNQYIKYEPEVIVEVISSSAYITDTVVDKYIAYTAFLP
jgi:Uma2 family endonuclease